MLIIKLWTYTILISKQLLPKILLIVLQWLTMLPLIVCYVFVSSFFNQGSFITVHIVNVRLLSNFDGMVYWWFTIFTKNSVSTSCWWSTGVRATVYYMLVWLFGEHAFSIWIIKSRKFWFLNYSLVYVETFYHIVWHPTCLAACLFKWFLLVGRWLICWFWIEFWKR